MTTSNLIEARMCDPQSGSRVRCHVCPWRCNIGPDKLGVCRMRHNREGVLYSLNYGLVSSIAADPIEKKPLFHFHPGTLCFSLGSYGCNFHCIHCQNWSISCTEPGEVGLSQLLAPDIAVELARRNGCAGISWTYNEPTIWFEYTYDCARLARAQGLYTVYVTNGFITAEALDEIGPYLDAFRVDIKGFSDSFYRNLARVVRWQEVLEAARRAKTKWNIHVEVVTNVIPTMNDDEEQLRDIACWVREELGELTPWHVTRFHPQYQLTHLPITPVDTLETARRIGLEEGLRFVYLGNVPGHGSESTQCYSCGQILIKRYGYDTRVLGLKGSVCSRCGAEVGVRSSAARKAP
ncbi:MAG: AmmeMemoRadiSam system radical SAM enzyme, partial [Dehalococcoidia bacterium]|nr:AmmeMemoRadiSam system radical SAM enzyme [Dehalococcoidia bacterium]